VIFFGAETATTGVVPDVRIPPLSVSQSTVAQAARRSSRAVLRRRRRAAAGCCSRKGPRSPTSCARVPGTPQRWWSGACCGAALAAHHQRRSPSNRSIVLNDRDSHTPRGPSRHQDYIGVLQELSAVHEGRAAHGREVAALQDAERVDRARAAVGGGSPGLFPQHSSGFFQTPPPKTLYSAFSDKH